MATINQQIVEAFHELIASVLVGHLIAAADNAPNRPERVAEITFIEAMSYSQFKKDLLEGLKGNPGLSEEKLLPIINDGRLTLAALFQNRNVDEDLWVDEMYDYLYRETNLPEAVTAWFHPYMAQKKNS